MCFRALGSIYFCYRCFSPAPYISKLAVVRHRLSLRVFYVTSRQNSRHMVSARYDVSKWSVCVQHRAAWKDQGKPNIHEAPGPECM